MRIFHARRCELENSLANTIKCSISLLDCVLQQNVINNNHASNILRCIVPRGIPGANFLSQSPIEGS